MRSVTAELNSTPQRWRRAARVALITAAGAAVTASLQIGNALGLTLLFNLGVPETQLTLTAAAGFLGAAGILQIAGMALAAAMADWPIAHLATFTALSLASSYVIFADPRLGRLWVWAQVPVLTAFYLVIFDPGGFVWTGLEAFGSVCVAVAILHVVNTLLWPKCAREVLSESLADTVDRSRRRLQVLLEFWLAGAERTGDRPVASKLGYHVSLLGPGDGSGRAEAATGLIGAVLAAERIHNEIERIAELMDDCAEAPPDAATQSELREAGAEVDAMLEAYAGALRGAPESGTGGGRRPSRSPAGDAAGGGRAAGAPASRCAAALAARLHNIRVLLQTHPAPSLLAPDSPPGLSQASRTTGAKDHSPTAEVRQPPAFSIRHRPNRFLVRYAMRHTVAMGLAFVAGLVANDAAMHAALWLLMIGGPPSHGATARKFTIRAVGAALAMVLAALAIIVVAPNGTSLFSYSAAIFCGSMLMAYIGQGGGLLSYLSIGGTAFVIAFSGPGPRNDAFASIWTIWGISFGMLIRAAVSVLWRERPSRTLVEEFQPPLEALLMLVSASHADWINVQAAQWELMRAVTHMLTVASDAQLQGRGAAINPANLVDALDTLCSIGLALHQRALRNVTASAQSDGAQMEPQLDWVESALRLQFVGWLESLRAQEAAGVPSRAPLREMVLSGAQLNGAQTHLHPESDAELIDLVKTFQEQLVSVSIY